MHLLSSAIQLACVNSPVSKLKFWRDVSYSPKLTSLWKNMIICVILDKNQLNWVRLVHAMHSNGPLPQVYNVPCGINAMKYCHSSAGNVSGCEDITFEKD